MASDRIGYTGFPPGSREELEAMTVKKGNDFVNALEQMVVPDDGPNGGDSVASEVHALHELIKSLNGQTINLRQMLRPILRVDEGLCAAEIFSAKPNEAVLMTILRGLRRELEGVHADISEMQRRVVL